MIKIGDKIHKRIFTGRVCDYPDGFTGTVIYIHPKHHFYTLEFEFEDGKIRENYFNWEGIR